MLSVFVKEKQDDWDKHRSARHESTKTTPNMLMLGREIGLPLDLVVEAPKENHLRASQPHQKRCYDLKLHGSGYGLGSLVWLYTPQRKPGRAPKLQCWWDGPFIVLSKIDDVTYRIQKSPRSKPKMVQYSSFKPYLGEVQADWWTKAVHVAETEPQSLDGEELSTRGDVEPAGPRQDRSGEL
ncbi:uncharacterized protein LOC119740133 [Patiria miniata]|uniref:Integrase p58-like C-terminal domain-containing protein n=1 Tax=Patiria miniata TaxID=46514 RepID=A0A914B5Q3_PATMI|nr:uncharacterized protein LOC119740133 [Patiria miniata]